MYILNDLRQILGKQIGNTLAAKGNRFKNYRQRALDAYNQTYGKCVSRSDWDLKQIHEFIQNCLKTAQKEGAVRVFFG